VIQPLTSGPTSGANIIEHAWTEQRKQELHDSRVKLSQLLVASIRASPDPPRVFIGISSTSIYPTTPEPNYIEWSESSPIPPESQLPNFAMSLCRSWEDTYNSLDHSISSSTTTTTSSASSACSCSCSCSCSMPSRSSMVRPATRLVIVRIPQVLSSKGRMLTHVKLAFQLGLGGTLGSGRQLFPWIHIDDWTSFVELAIKSEDIRGTFNLVAPEIADNAQFTAALASGTSHSVARATSHHLHSIDLLYCSTVAAIVLLCAVVRGPFGLRRTSPAATRRSAHSVGAPS